MEHTLPEVAWSLVRFKDVRAAKSTEAFPAGLIDTEPAERDHDGMPDEWESVNGLDPDDNSDSQFSADRKYP